MKAHLSSRLPSAEELAEFCRRNHIRKLALFGSAVRDEMRPGSDVDVLVQFEPGHTPGFRFFEMQAELSQLFGRSVDLSTPGFLSPRIRRDVEQEAEVLFAA